MIKVLVLLVSGEDPFSGSCSHPLTMSTHASRGKRAVGISFTRIYPHELITSKSHTSTYHSQWRLSINIRIGLRGDTNIQSVTPLP